MQYDPRRSGRGARRAPPPPPRRGGGCGRKGRGENEVLWGYPRKPNPQRTRHGLQARDRLGRFRPNPPPNGGGRGITKRDKGFNSLELSFF